MPERGDQLLPLLGMRLAKRDPIVGAQQRLGDRRRARIGDGNAVGVVRADGFQVGREQVRNRLRRRRFQEPRDPVAPFRRAPRLRALEVITPCARVGVDEAEGRVLAPEVDKNARQERMLDDIGETAGVKAVTVVHRLKARPLT